MYVWPTVCAAVILWIRVVFRKLNEIVPFFFLLCQMLNVL